MRPDTPQPLHFQEHLWLFRIAGVVLRRHCSPLCHLLYMDLYTLNDEEQTRDA